MSGDDQRELSGLARSIDALFADTRRQVAASDDAPPTESPVGAEAESEPRVVDRVEASAEPEMLEESSAPVPPAIREEPVTVEEWGDASELEATVVEEPAAPRPVAPPPLPEGSVTQGGPGVVEADDGEGDDDLSPAARAEPDVGEELERAVDAFLAGDAGSRARLEEAAEPLRERLALDPVADAVERLVREAGDPPDPTITEAATAITNPAVASRIVQRIGQVRDEGEKAGYTVLCQRVGEIMARALRGALTDATDLHARRAYYDMLIAMGDASRPIVEAMVDDENRFLVRNAVAILGETGGERAVELVTSALAHPDPRVRREALLSLAKLGAEEEGPLVVGFFEDPEPDVRVAAATAAGELGVERAQRPLLSMLEEERDPEVLVPVIRALGQLGDPGAVPGLEKHAVRSLFSKPPTEVRLAAYRALHRIGTPHARELVRAALEDKEPPVQSLARELARSEAK